ncbi:hypothetical protein RJT34_23315 [Clitoria ternatea]|uniref:Uncharacterized protein n=1 Tax=Clitoria ternatea TaxID=43366 RepID=A0AAN9IH30_CLITE
MSSSMDGSLRIWDIILAKHMDVIHVDIPITALSLSIDMNTLATAHVDQNELSLWVLNVDSCASGKEVISVKLLSTEHSQVEVSNGLVNAAFIDYIKGLSSSTLYMELQMFQIIDDDDPQEAKKRLELVLIEQLLDYLMHEISCRNNFEFLQGVLKLFLKVRETPRVGQCMVRQFGGTYAYKRR